jgi:hypothetical protein
MGVVLQFSFSVQAVIIDGPSGEDYMFFDCLDYLIPESPNRVLPARVPTGSRCRDFRCANLR